MTAQSDLGGGREWNARAEEVMSEAAKELTADLLGSLSHVAEQARFLQRRLDAMREDGAFDERAV